MPVHQPEICWEDGVIEFQLILPVAVVGMGRPEEGDWLLTYSIPLAAKRARLFMYSGVPSLEVDMGGGQHLVLLANTSRIRQINPNGAAPLA